MENLKNLGQELTRQEQRQVLGGLSFACDSCTGKNACSYECLELGCGEGHCD